jgi:hypothetical protein
MTRREPSYRQQADHRSVYTLTDRQLADEYRRLTGSLVQVPSSRNRVVWWQWRNDLQKKVRKARSSRRAWTFAPRT